MTNFSVIFQEVRILIEQLGFPVKNPVQREHIILGENWLETHPIYQRNEEIPTKYIHELGILVRIHDLLDKVTPTNNHNEFFTYCHGKQRLRNHSEARRLRVLALLIEEGFLVFKSDYVLPEHDMPEQQDLSYLEPQPSTSNSPKNYYAVARGRRVGIYTTWSLCKDQIHGYSGSIYKKFNSFDEAVAFIDEHNQ